MIKVDENDPIGELEPSFPYRDVQIKWNVDVKQYYELQSEIGRGKFGTVYKCKEKETGLSLAAKFVAIARRQDRRNVEREVEIMRELQHPRLIQIYDAFESSNVMCVVLELIEGGELFERVIDDDFVLTEKSCTVFMRQICEAVEFIHSKDILHLDMKPENILCLTKTGNRIKIIDFGLARKFDPGKKLQVLFGTPEFVAPEVVNFDQIGFGTDMWSVGVICYVLLSGLSPFMGETDVATMANVTIALYDFDDDAFSSISEDARDFIRKLLVKDKDARLTATQCLQHPWLRRKQPLPKPKVEQLESTKDNLRSFVDRWGDGTSPVPFIVQSPNNVKEIETGEPKLPSGMTPPDHIKPSVVIPKDVQIKIDALSPTSPHSPLPKKIKLQDEAGSESAKTKTGKKSDSKPKNGSIKKSKTLATDKESTQKNNEKGKESVNDISKCDSYSTQRKNSDHNCLVTPEPKLIAKSSPKLERNVDAESVDNQLEKSHDIENKLPTPQSLGPAKTDCDKNLSKNNLITIFNNSRNIKPGGGNECGKNEEISNSASSNSISTQQLGVRDALLTNGNDAAQGSSNLTSVLSKDTSKPSTNGVGYQKDLSNQTPDSPSMNAKVEATLPPPNTNIALKNETTLHQSNETEPHQKQTPASVILPTIQNKTNQQSEAKILTDASSTSAISSLPRINIIPIKVEKSDSSPLGGKTTIGRGSEVEGNNAHLEDKPKKVSNISGLKSIWGSKISANESKSTGHPIVKYNRTLSSPTPNTAKSRTTISQRQNKLEENEVTTSQTASTLNPVKVVLHRIEVDNNHSGAQNTKMLPNQKANSTETRLKINLDSCRNQNSNNSSFNDTKYTNNNYLSLNSNSSNDTSKKSPINEWVNEKLLNDRFKIDRRASDISSLVDKDSFYGDSVDMMGSRIAEEISKITDKFCRINDESDSGNGRGMLLGKPPANVQQIQQDRHDKITDLLNGKRRPKYRRLTYMNRDVPLGSTPPPTNLTYYLTNLNSTNPLWAANFEVPSCNFFSAPGTPIGSPRSPTETSLDHDIIFQMLSDKLKEVESNISAKKANMVNT